MSDPNSTAKIRYGKSAERMYYADPDSTAKIRPAVFGIHIGRRFGKSVEWIPNTAEYDLPKVSMEDANLVREFTLQHPNASWEIRRQLHLEGVARLCAEARKHASTATPAKVDANTAPAAAAEPAKTAPVVVMPPPKTADDTPEALGAISTNGDSAGAAATAAKAADAPAPVPAQSTEKEPTPRDEEKKKQSVPVAQAGQMAGNIAEQADNGQKVMCLLECIFWAISIVALTFLFMNVLGKHDSSVAWSNGLKLVGGRLAEIPSLLAGAILTYAGSQPTPAAPPVPPQPVPPPSDAITTESRYRCEARGEFDAKISQWAAGHLDIDSIIGEVRGQVKDAYCLQRHVHIDVHMRATHDALGNRYARVQFTLLNKDDLAEDIAKAMNFQNEMNARHTLADVDVKSWYQVWTVYTEAGSGVRTRYAQLATKRWLMAKSQSSSPQKHKA